MLTAKRLQDRLPPCCVMFFTARTKRRALPDKMALPLGSGDGRVKKFAVMHNEVRIADGDDHPLILHPLHLVNRQRIGEGEIEFELLEVVLDHHLFMGVEDKEQFVFHTDLKDQTDHPVEDPLFKTFISVFEAIGAIAGHIFVLDVHDLVHQTVLILPGFDRRF